MQIIRLLCAATALLWAALGTAWAAPNDASFDRLLGKYVVAKDDGVNRVDYAAWKGNQADRNALNAYIKEFEKTAISKLPRQQQFAAWANLYNAVTVKVILDNYPVKSIRDIKSGLSLDPAALAGGPWWNKYVTVEGKQLTLNNIEHDILRKQFRDPRVHYAVNCASYGCPNLLQKAWRAETLEADLDAAARAYVNHPRGALLMAGELEVSSIYVWFKSDFGNTDQGVIDHLKKYATPSLAAKLQGVTKIAGHDYSWALNKAGN
jgi:hypothetical protein